MRALNPFSEENIQFDFSPEDVFAPPAWYFEQSAWIREPKSPGNAAHNYPLPIRIRGPLNRELLEQSLREVLRRHSVLRSVFRMADGKPVQLIMPVQPLNIPLLDLSGKPEDVRATRVSAAVFEDSRRPFDLTQGPMLRVGLLRLTSEEHVLLLTTHHIVCDYWSTRILLRELFTLYAAFSGGRPSPLPELDFQYRDFVRWLERRWQTREAELFGFWKEYLAGMDFHHLAPDHAPPMPRSYRGTHERAIFPEKLSNSIKMLGARERLSPFMIMLAGLQCLVQRYSGDENVGIGSCVANRPLPQVEGLIGPFANVSVLRTNLAGNPSFRELLRRVRDICLAAFECQDTPFGALVDKFQPTFDPVRHPVFQILFVFLNGPTEPWDVPGLTVDPIAVDSGMSCFELNMNVRFDAPFEIDLQYSSDLFEAATIRQLLSDYRAVLEAICANPDAQIDDLGITKKKQTAIDRKDEPKNARTEYVAPTGVIESQLVELWEAVLNKRPIGVNDDFFVLGGDSLRAARLFARINEAFKRSLLLDTLFESPTVATLAKVISEGNSRDTGVVTIQSGNASPPLFCIPGQTGSVLIFRTLARHLGSDQRVYGLQSQGLDGKQPPLVRIEDMAANFVKQLRVVQPKGPYFLVGYCMGGTLALEIAQQLIKLGEPIGLLALLDTYNWRVLKRTSFLDDFYFRAQQWCFSWHRGGLRWKELHEGKGLVSLPALLLPGENAVFRKFREFWDSPGAEHVSECNRKAACSYLPKAYPGRILHVRSTKQFARYKSPTISLNRFAAQGVEEFLVRGYPAQMLLEPAARDLGAKLKACIETAAGACPRWYPSIPGQGE